MSLSTQELHDLGLNTDAMAGFEAQVAVRKWRIEVVPPGHYAGRRITDFEFGARVARSYMAERAGVGRARRMSRARESRETGGMMTVLRAGTAGELRREQLTAVRSIVERLRRVATEVAEVDGGTDDMRTGASP